MNLFKCRMCGENISKWDYENKLYCSDKCRQRAYRLRKEKNNPENTNNKLKGVTERGDL